jgi:Superinfection immunity protein/Protein of unknown function (DUF2510)
MQPFGPPSPTGDAPQRHNQPTGPTIPAAPTWVSPPPPMPSAQRPVTYSTVAGSSFVTDQREVNGAVVALAWVVTVISVGYMLPWAIAATRGRSNQAAIGLLNFFLGWTLIGWIVALVMACQAHQVVGVGGHATVVVAPNVPNFAPRDPPSHSASPAAGWYPAPSGGGQQYWDGTAWTEHRAP